MQKLNSLSPSHQNAAKTNIANKLTVTVIVPLISGNKMQIERHSEVSD